MSTRLRERTIKKLETRDKRPTAIAKYVRIPSSKMELVLDLIRGKGYEESVAILKNTNKSSSVPVLKVLESAAANAENNLSIMKDNLYVAECWATQGPTLKRMMPRARGRADRILKRSCHIRIVLDEKKEVKKEVKKVTKKSIPTTEAEKPLTDKPNTNQKPLGEKEVPSKKPAVKKEVK
jgi:large subunit ribosomal protein L22